MASPFDVISSMLLMDTGSASYRLDVLYPITDVILFILVITSVFMFWQINNYLKKIKARKCADYLEGMKYFFYSLYIYAAVFAIVLTELVCLRIIYNSYFPIGMIIVIIVLYVMATALQCKALTAFSSKMRR